MGAQPSKITLRGVYRSIVSSGRKGINCGGGVNRRQRKTIEAMVGLYKPDWLRSLA